MRDYLFEPAPLALYPGETIRLTVFNAGLEPHELVLGDAAAQAAWGAADAAATPPAPFTTSPPASAPAGTGGLRLLVGSGQQATADWTVPAADAAAPVPPAGPPGARHDRHGDRAGRRSGEHAGAVD